MVGFYDSGLVLLSYAIAVLASYSALYFGAQLTTISGIKSRLWLTLGALSMGTGVWTMHFVGMRAYVMPVEMTYDLAMTVSSWLAAILASGLALHMISLKKVGWVQLAVSSLAMGGGIAIMHYVGMMAMNMSPGLTYDPAIFSVSVVIAVAASGAAMAICRTLQSSTGNKALFLQLGGALVMGVAICGMHYTGMAAVIYPDSAMPAADNLLSGDWLGIPLGLTSAVLIVMALAASAVDVKKRNVAVVQAEEEASRLQQLAFVDKATGLPNRVALDRHLLNLIAENHASERSFALLYLDIANYRDIESSIGAPEQAAIASGVRAALDSATAYLAKYSASTFIVVVEGHTQANQKAMYERLKRLPEYVDAPEGVDLVWRAGQSVFPDTGRSSRMLVRVAMKTGDLKNIGRFNRISPAYQDPLSAPLSAS
ncbi:MHYT domain-containing protein [Marinobacter caseinilyticus]|uniref:MHYT domain-containing protein n=1 Tax=Marinobacter caseinilyticus TaxID=2692195 RepID=UPI00140B26B1|nr:MHYT domain-containing protein [Marinobacter caseinilyticus]